MSLSPSIQLKIKNLTDDPGVYLMKGADGEILYVGKAKNLKNRVSSYFQESKGHTPRIQLLVRRIADFELVITDTEVEALVLECNLIKKYRPRFNVRLKDDKTYPYIRLDVNHPFPRLEFTRKVRKDGARYFGPYVSGGRIRDLLENSRRGFKLRDCSDNEFKNRSRPCILYQMGQCSAPCVGLVSGEDYGRAVDYVLKILDGKIPDVRKGLAAEMEAAAEEEQFERAAELRDRLRWVEELSAEEQDEKLSPSIQDPESDANRDAVQIARRDGHAVAVVMAVRDGRMVGVFQFPFSEVDPDMSDADFVMEFLSQYYVPQIEDESPVGLPREILIPDVQAQEGGEFLKAQFDLISRAFSKRLEFRIPKRGAAVELLELARKTAENRLEEVVKNKQQLESDLQDLQERLHLQNFPRRLECFDISHFQGEGTVASRVVFVDGRPEKTLYRHYHVREVSGPDDFKSMLEVLRRRFEKGDALPDLVVIDGGRGQLAQAVAVFVELGVLGVELVSLAKARTEADFEEAEVASSMERVFKPGQKNPIMLKPGTGAYRVMTQARDESHRFAITFHRKVRDKRILSTRKTR